jgi:hypothetical protein
MSFRREVPVVPIRGVHLDLKGLPPTPGRLLQLLDVFAAMRLNAVLVEWEDTFPWEVDPRFRSETAYSIDVIEAFHRRAREVGLSVIPLVQSLGHMETPLSFPEYASLREIPNQCDGMNPLAPGARELVEKMVDEVLGRSGPITHFHLGGDEAFTFGRHPDTRAYIEKHGKAALYLQHIEPLLDSLIDRGIRPILWHDMMHDWDDASLAQLGAKADLMAWSYQGHPDNAPGKFNTKVIERFHRAGVPLWGASAYKGADSPGDAELPDPARRTANAIGWVDIARRFDLIGVIATGWSRYTTHRVQCEPIDGALDVLAQTAIAFHDGGSPADGADDELLRSLGEWDRFSTCKSGLERFSKSTREAWKYLVLAHEQTSLQQSDVRRRDSGILGELLRILSEHIDAGAAAADDVRRTLKGLVDDIWIDRFCEERLRPLREQLSHARDAAARL